MFAFPQHNPYSPSRIKRTDDLSVVKNRKPHLNQLQNRNLTELFLNKNSKYRFDGFYLMQKQIDFADWISCCSYSCLFETNEFMPFPWKLKLDSSLMEHWKLKLASIVKSRKVLIRTKIILITFQMQRNCRFD